MEAGQRRLCEECPEAGCMSSAPSMPHSQLDPYVPALSDQRDCRPLPKRGPWLLSPALDPEAVPGEPCMPTPRWQVPRSACPGSESLAVHK